MKAGGIFIVYQAMVITLIMPHAGMGNQMFMYCAGLSTAHKLHTELLLDTQGFKAPDMRSFYLANFPNITERKASFKEIYSLAPAMALTGFLGLMGASIYKHPFRRLLLETINKTAPATGGRIFSSMNLPEDVFDDVYIQGFWESERYFVGIKDLVRKKFEFAPQCFDPEMSARIRACNSVAIHVRRGDKVNNRGFRASDGGYIMRAMNKISELVNEPKFFVFSDDITWCRENMPKICEAEYTFIEGHTPPQDMALMTKKIIIVPDSKLWYKEPGKVRSNPPEWLHMS